MKGNGELMKVTYLEKEVRTFDFHPSVSNSFCHFRLYFAFNLQPLQCVLVGYQPCTSFFSLLLVQSRKEDRQLSGSAVVELAVTVLQRENQNNIRFSMIQKEISIFAFMVSLLAPFCHYFRAAPRTPRTPPDEPQKARAARSLSTSQTKHDSSQSESK
jgi:hypothetical protein